MPLQSSIATRVIIAPQTDLVTQALANVATAKSYRRVSTNLGINKAAFASNEVRGDQQVYDMRHGTRGAGGTLSGELSTQTYDDLIEAAVRGTWVAGVTDTQASWTTPNVAFNAGAKTATFGASGGNLITKGFRVGDTVVFTTLPGAAGTALNNQPLKITALTPTVMTFGASSIIPTSATNATWALAVSGKKLYSGVVQRAFTAEVLHNDIDVSEILTGCRVGGMAVRAQPNGMVTADFEFLGRDGQVLTGANSPYFTAASADTATGILSAVGGLVVANGGANTVITGFDMSINNNLSAPPVIGSNLVPEIFYGRQVVTGNVSFFLQDEIMLNYFLNETEITLMVRLTSATGDFIDITLPRVKLNGAQKNVGADGGVIIQAPYQALLAAVSGTDPAAVVIQRSNP